jgi:beta-lactamase regulating signal transducer with metallopeptidase domain/HEAT repeat protein
MTMRFVGWAIIHSLWQGGVIALISAVLLAATRRSRPNVRYGIALVALALMVITPLMTARDTSDQANPEEPTASPAISNNVIDNTSISSASNGLTSPAQSTEPRQPINLPAPSIINRANSSPFVEAALPWLVTIWMLGLLLSSVRLIGGFARTRRITRKAASDASRALALRLEILCDRLAITRAVKAVESLSIDVPLVIGAIRPVIVVPLSLVTSLTPFQLDMLLSHELAHVRRNDYLVNLIQTIVETLLFYHPAARWLSERARDERENCCDDIAMKACGVDAREYTATLLVLEEARGQAFNLAAAATGGSLLHRAQRLLTGRPAYLELGPRWIAGVFTVGAALFAGNDAVAAISASYVPAARNALAKDSTRKTYGVDMTQARPSRVIKAPTSGSIADRWRWAERNSGSNDYWIGYLIAGDETGKSKFYASDVPVRAQGNATFSGRMRFDNGNISNLVFSGVPLESLVGPHSPQATAIFIRVKDGALGTRIDRLHMSTFMLPGYFANKPLVWLDSASDVESISLIRSLMSKAANDDAKRDLVGAIGVHRDARTAVPVLINILESRESESVRREAVEWIGGSNDSRATAVLSRAVRTDRTNGVREEAVESFGHMMAASATDSLIAFALELPTSDLRREAIEALGDRGDDRSLAFLERFARGSSSSDLRRQAIESLADMPDGRGMKAVIEIAQHDGSSDVRREAVESIASLEPASRAFEILGQIARTDPDESVRTEAVETIAEVHDAGSVRILGDIANRGSSEGVQVEAVESLGETVAPEAALPVLLDIARNHPAPQARKKALETIIDFKDEKTAIDAIVYAIRNDKDEEVRKDALEALGDADDAVAMKTLAGFIRGKESLDTRQEALKVYAESAKPGDAVAMLKSVMANDESAEMRMHAVELLDDVEGSEATLALREIASSNHDERVRSRAREILRDR